MNVMSEIKVFIKRFADNSSESNEGYFAEARPASAIAEAMRKAKFQPVAPVATSDQKSAASKFLGSWF